MLPVTSLSSLGLLPIYPIQVAWTPGQESEVAAGMLDIFHKLPPPAKKFLETQGGCRGWPFLLFNSWFAQAALLVLRGVCFVKCPHSRSHPSPRVQASDPASSS